MRQALNHGGEADGALMDTTPVDAGPELIMELSDWQFAPSGANGGEEHPIRHACQCPGSVARSMVPPMRVSTLAVLKNPTIAEPERSLVSKNRALRALMLP